MEALAWVLTFVSWVLVSLVGLVTCLVLVPIQFSVRGVCEPDRLEALARLSWGHGVVTLVFSEDRGIAANVLGLRVYRHRRARRARPERRTRGTARKGGQRRARSLDFRVLSHIARRVLRSLNLRARVAGRLGSGDPAQTATLYAALAAARSVLPRVGAELDVRGVRVDWIEPAIDLEGAVAGRVWPAAIVWIALSELARSWWNRRTEEGRT